MKVERDRQFVHLVRRIHALLAFDPQNQRALQAWRGLFKALPVPPTLDEPEMERLRDWFDERIDGLAPALARSCDRVAEELLDLPTRQISEAEHTLATQLGGDTLSRRLPKSRPWEPVVEAYRRTVIDD